ncbi:MAG: metallophosphoesterase [Armatimonadetes bacterium]|nr:metallophosphoesterase [Armatimonadota bacterium]
MRVLTLLHTSDMHHRLTAEAAERLRALKARETRALLVDAGDAIRAGNLGITPWGERALEWMRLAGYDAMAVGNRETHPWSRAVRAKVGRASFPVLCANVSGPGVAEGSFEAVPVGDLPCFGRDRALYRSHVLAQLPGGLRVALFGLTVPMVRGTSAARWVGAYRFADPLETARRLVPLLAPRADLVVALTHLGLERDRELARQVDGMDVIVGGHSHSLPDEPERVNGTMILHAGHYARFVGKAEISLESRPVSVRWTRVPLGEARGGTQPRP